LPGDVDEDGGLDIVDALLVARYYVNLDPFPFAEHLGDVDGDEDIDILDALLIARIYVDLEEEPDPVPC
jgi:hypothetical protein